MTIIWSFMGHIMKILLNKQKLEILRSWTLTTNIILVVMKMRRHQLKVSREWYPWVKRQPTVPKMLQMMMKLFSMMMAWLICKKSSRKVKVLVLKNLHLNNLIVCILIHLQTATKIISLILPSTMRYNKLI